MLNKKVLQSQQLIFVLNALMKIVFLEENAKFVKHLILIIKSITMILLNKKQIMKL